MPAPCLRIYFRPFVTLTFDLLTMIVLCLCFARFGDIILASLESSRLLAICCDYVISNVIKPGDTIWAQSYGMNYL